MDFLLIADIGTAPRHVVGKKFQYQVDCTFTTLQFSTECRKTKTKVISLTSRNGSKQSNEPIRT